MTKILKSIRQSIVNWCLGKKKVAIGDFHKSQQITKVSIPDHEGNLKFVESATPEDVYVETDIGYSKVKSSFKTVKYERFSVVLENGLSLDCADNHLLIDENDKEIFAKNVIPGLTSIKTEKGNSKVSSVRSMGLHEHMYDLELDDARHVYYTNGILSHNTTVVSMYILWLTTFTEDVTAVIASKAMSHATEIMSRIKYAYEELPDWLKAGCKFYNRTSIEFDNGSKIKSEATTEKTGRGNSPSFVFLDEIAFISKRIQDELWASLTPSLSTGGKFVLTSTPNGDDDLFANLWRGAMSGANNFKPVKFLWDMHPDRDESYYNDMKGKLGPVKTRQELDCEFLSSDSLLVDAVKLSQIRSKKPIFSQDDFDFFVGPEDLSRIPIFLVSLDPATGSGNDNSSIQVFSFPALVQVAEFKSNSVKIPFIYMKLKTVLRKLTLLRNPAGQHPEVYWSFERNAIGEAIAALYFNDEHQIESAELISDDRMKFGMYTTNRSKVQAALKLKSLIEKVSGGMTINSEHLLFELKNYAQRGASYEAKPGATDDSVSALLILIRILDYMAKFNEIAHKKVYDYEVADEQIEEPMPFVIV